MRARTKVMMLAAAAIVSFSCEEGSQITAYKEIDLTRDTYKRNLLGSWSRSFEEEPMQGEVEVYRRADSREFPPAWFRRRYVFNGDRTCEWLVLHPSDVHYMTSGTWDVDHRDKMVVLIYDPDGRVVENVSFRVIELRADILRITRISN